MYFGGYVLKKQLIQDITHLLIGVNVFFLVFIYLMNSEIEVKK